MSSTREDYLKRSISSLNQSEMFFDHVMHAR